MRIDTCALAFGSLPPAAVQQAQKGGEDETGPYEAVANRPQPWSKQLALMPKTTQ